MKKIFLVFSLVLLLLSNISAAITIGFDEIKDLPVIEMEENSGRVRTPSCKFYDFRFSLTADNPLSSSAPFVRDRNEITHLIPFVVNLASFELNSVYDDSRFKIYANVYPTSASSIAQAVELGFEDSYIHYFDGYPLFLVALGDFSIEIRILDTVDNRVYGHTYDFATELQSTKKPGEFLICSENNPEYEPLSGMDIYLQAPGTIGHGVVIKYDPTVSDDFIESRIDIASPADDDLIHNLNWISWVPGGSTKILSDAAAGSYALVYHYYSSPDSIVFSFANYAGATSVSDEAGDQIWIERFEVVD